MEKITEGKIRLAQASKLPAIPYKLKGTKIIVFDTETTGVTEDDEIIQPYNWLQWFSDDRRCFRKHRSIFYPY